MQAGISLQSLAERVLGEAQARTDLVAPVQRIQADVEASGVTFHVGVHEIEPQPLFSRQVNEFLGIPPAYGERLASVSPRNAADDINLWLRKQEPTKKRLVRTLDLKQPGQRLTGRAFLSDSFRALDNADLVGAALPVLAEQGFEIKSANLTDQRLYLQAVTPRIETEVKVGDVVQLGLLITNSEVGLGALAIKFLLYRLWCKNGACSQSVFRKAHVGRSKHVVEEDVVSQYYSDDTRRLDDAAFFAKLRDVIRGAATPAALEAQVEPLRIAAGIELKRPEAAVEVVAKRLDLNQIEREGVLANLIRGGDLSLWGLSNAVTALAHTSPSYDRSVELESLGHTVIDLPRSAWSEVL
jgi:Domain of unknown function (DUF932)